MIETVQATRMTEASISVECSTIRRERNRVEDGKKLGHVILKCSCGNVKRVAVIGQGVVVDGCYNDQFVGGNVYCSKCSRRMTITWVHGTYNAEKVCNGRCMSATSGACECQCDGANHGSNHG